VANTQGTTISILSFELKIFLNLIKKFLSQILFLELRLLREKESVREEVMRHILEPNAEGVTASFKDVYEFIW
jgi:hypothetical protein